MPLLPWASSRTPNFEPPLLSWQLQLLPRRTTTSQFQLSLPKFFNLTLYSSPISTPETNFDHKKIHNFFVNS